MNTSSNTTFDVFISHNSKDKCLIRELCKILHQKGLNIWFDEQQLRPGLPWQKLIEDGIRNSKSVIVALGNDGHGPWEREEMDAALNLAVKSKLPVFSVLLPGAEIEPVMPMILDNRTRVDLRNGFTDEGINLLVWGITGTSEKSTADTAVSPGQGRRFRAKLNCAQSDRNDLHFRNTAYITKLCTAFPETEFKIIRGNDDETLDPKDYYSFATAQLHHGEVVTIEVSGALEVMAGEFLKVVLENLAGYCDDTRAVKAKLMKLIDSVFWKVFDPDLADIMSPLDFASRIDTPRVSDESRIVVAINDRLHDLTIPMIPRIAQQFECSLTLALALGDKGVFLFTMSAENQFHLDPLIVDLDVGVGTQITIFSRGSNREAAARAVASVLQNLWQCDRWLRLRPRQKFHEKGTVEQLIQYAQELSKMPKVGYDIVVRPFISNVLTIRNIIINPTGRVLTKEAVIRQLSESAARELGIDATLIEDCVSKVESVTSIVPKPGFAMLHGAMDWGPRLFIAFGVYPAGVDWSAEHTPVKLVAMFVCARDTHRTWRDYMKRINLVFRKHPKLQDALVAAKSPREFGDTLRRVEESMTGD